MNIYTAREAIIQLETNNPERELYIAQIPTDLLNKDPDWCIVDCFNGNPRFVMITEQHVKNLFPDYRE